MIQAHVPGLYRHCQTVRENLWRDGGCIAQCEFGPGAAPENVYMVFRAWNGDQAALDR